MCFGEQQQRTVTAVAEGLTSLAALAAAAPDGVQEIHAGSNAITSLEGAAAFPQLQTLVLDNNRLTGVSELPAMPELETLWLNNNAIADLPALLADLREKAPRLRYLSMLGNPACCAELSGARPSDIAAYRSAVSAALPQLRFLDAAPLPKAPGASPFSEPQSGRSLHATYRKRRRPRRLEGHCEGNRFIGNGVL
eukprot:TRINITY_DN423_c1_g2_i2.p2 TRINITY_DN423_c1_g2~~TRINITY_DN423_c1_g2_i2.p2  ORF type:complete len:195 (+),score=74.15 TRINITY_DN423_c1_g2_i2:78-662(+)